MNYRKPLNLGPVLFLAIYQAVLILTLPVYLYYAGFDWKMWSVAVVLLYLTGLSITAGYHRYFSHRSFKTKPWMENVILFFATMSAQGSALRWSFDHRIHHAKVDTDEDPYSISKGFWYAHFLWILDNPKQIDSKIVPDLLKNKRVMFQHNYYGLLMVLTNFFAFLLVGWLLNDFWGALFIATFTRMMALHHFTWFINSLAHTWGDKPFCTEQSAVDNYIISLLTFGEGYHNYHHTYANDYRNGVRWYHFDPTKWLIWTLSKLGLAKGLRRMDPFTVKKRIVEERKDLLLNRVKQLWHVKKDELEQQILEISSSIEEKMAAFKTLKEKYREDYAKRPTLKSELKQLKKSLRNDWKQWKQLSRRILNLKPI